MPNGHGGRRPGAGRKPKAERWRGKVKAGEKLIADEVLELIRELFRVAHGYTYDEVTYVPAALVALKLDVVNDDGSVTRGVERLAFPELAPDEPVAVKVVRKRVPADFRAIAYGIDRIFGRMALPLPPPLEGADDGSIGPDAVAMAAEIRKSRDAREAGGG